MKQRIYQLLGTAPVALAMALAAGSLQAQQADVKSTTPQQSQGSGGVDAEQPKTQPSTGVDSAREPMTAVTEKQARDASATASRPNMAPESSDRNVPPATARKQAAEIARGDPARWFREDASAAARLRTLQKEIGAGLQEAQGNCRRQPAAERAACMKEARAIYQREMAGARAQVMAERGR